MCVSAKNIWPIGGPSPAPESMSASEMRPLSAPSISLPLMAASRISCAAATGF
jgi:hypothetical protein